MELCRLVEVTQEQENRAMFLLCRTGLGVGVGGGGECWLGERSPEGGRKSIYLTQVERCYYHQIFSLIAKKIKGPRDAKKIKYICTRRWLFWQRKFVRNHFYRDIKGIASPQCDHFSPAFYLFLQKHHILEGVVLAEDGVFDW